MDSERAAAAACDETAKTASSRRILVADDEANVVRVLTFLLAKQGYEVRTAEDGEAALRLVREFRPHLLILDVMMPKMDGYDICRLVREDPASSSCYILLLSARGQAADRQTGLQAGADEYVTKPFATSGLLEHIREIFERLSAEGRDSGRFSSAEAGPGSGGSGA